MDVSQAIADGETYIKNADEALDRKVLREDQLYMWENQVEVIDTYLADTEELAAGAPELADMRDRVREKKKALEQKTMEFLAEQEGTDVPESLPPEEEAELFVEPGRDLVQMVDDALAEKVKGIEHVATWEEPLVMVNSYLADSETFEALNPDLKKVRAELKGRKGELAKRIEDVVGAWRAQDAVGGDD